MTLLLTALAALAAGAAAPWLLYRTQAGARVAAAGAVAGCAAGLAAAIGALAAGDPTTLRLPWLATLGGAFHLRADPLSALFLALLFLIGGLAAPYGLAYMRDESRGRAAVAASGYNLLLASMALVFLAGNALLFLVAWEVMALSSFFLVTLDHEHAASRRAGWLYLIATHVGTTFLIAFMLVMGLKAGSLDFDTWTAAGAGLAPRAATLLFVCALIGFGTKAGFVPLHVWLPEAHPAAPSHVSALMSGVMIKTGIYGLLRLLPCLGAPPAAWGWALALVGVASGVVGVLFALAQKDIKRLLAYSSVENVGIVAIGLGAGMLGQAAGLPRVAALGYAGALLHTVNHAILKSLMFMGAGAVYRQTGTRALDVLGGLLRRMPFTGLCVMLGSAAIAGLPPFGGFVGEFLIYGAGLAAAQDGHGALQPVMLACIGGLALIGCLAAACFARLFGMAFLGEPRSPAAEGARDAAPAMRAPMGVLAVLSLGAGLLAPAAVRSLAPVVAGLLQAPEADVLALLPGWRGPLGALAAVLWGLLLLAGLLAALRSWLLAGREVRQAVTWDCGYARPAARMQYTASSFSQPLMAVFADVLRSRRRLTPPRGIFPSAASSRTDTADVFHERVFTPAFRLVEGWLSLLKWLQSGRIQLYVLYIVIALLALLYWSIRR